MVVSLKGHSYNESQDAALPARELCLLCTLKNRWQVSSIWNLLAVTSWNPEMGEAGLGWLCKHRGQGTGSLCSAGKPGKQMARREKRCERDEEMSHLHAFNFSRPPGKMCWNACGWGRVGENENKATSYQLACKSQEWLSLSPCN